ncbi:MAG: isopeptide-forming domain-containing fimbrial protein [Eubacteriales bacterium]|nr:isopeptide-forming domain-containing fimbrial protein [Eubacteriales bacterium]
MKTLKRLSSVLLAVFMVMAMAIPAFAVQSGTLTINGTTSGKTYDLYKVLDLTQSGEAYSYTVNSNFTGFSYTVDENTTVTSENLVAYIKDASASDLSDVAKELVAYAVEHKIAPTESVTAQSTTATASLDYGYYVMNPRGGSGAFTGNATMFSLNTLSGKDTTINVKAVYPTVEKKADSAAVNEASIGEDVTFTLTSKVPDLTGYKWYKFVAVDTLSDGLDYKDVTSIKVGTKTLTENTDYIVDKTGGQTIRFILKDLVAAKYTAGDAIVITYTATLNDKAVIGTANENEAKIEYSNDPSYTQDSEHPYDPDDPDFKTNEPQGESGESKTETYTTSLTLNKVDESGNALTGAAFKITGDGVKKVLTVTDTFEKDADGEYWKLTDGTYTTTAPTTQDIDVSKYADTETRYTKKTTSTLKENTESTNVEASVGEDGKLTFAGLGAGTYTITETTTPDGYNSIADFTVTIAFDPDTKVFSATAGNSTTVSAVNNTLSMDVVNKTGTLLPSTGGMGTTIFYVIGGILVIGAGVILVSKKRMGAVK